MTNKNPVIRIQIPQILTSNFMMKYYYDDSIKEMSESKRSRMSHSQAVKMTASQGTASQGIINKIGKPSNNKQIISLEEVEKNKSDKDKRNSWKFKDNSSSNSLKPPSLDNTLKYPPGSLSNKYLSGQEKEVEGFRSVKKYIYY